ncbi:MAG: hypothetical protein AAFY82_10485 [Pseudomonadota bacterium]
MSDLETELTAWCASYLEAIHAWDAAAVAAHWTYPALTTQAGQSFTFKSVDHFTKNTERLLSFYQSQTVARVTRQLVSAQALHDQAAIITTSDAMFTADEARIAGWQAAYVLQRIDGDWKAVMGVADGESEAWAALGTRLGGSEG